MKNLEIYTIERLKYLFLILFILLMIRPAPVSADISENTFPLPIFELESVVLDWLKDSGFKINRSTTDMGRIKITSVKEKETWILQLTRRSSLATEIKADIFPEKQSDHVQIKKLWDGISEYINASSANLDSSDQQAPTSILSKIESVVCIKAVVKGRDFQISGFIVDPEGFIICTAHNLSDIQTVSVIFNDGYKEKGNIIKINFHFDLALIQVKRKSETFIPLKQGRNLLGMGERLYSIGCPVNFGGTIYAGSINSPPRRSDDLPLWQVNMEIHPGSSGSPVFDIQGNLVAIIKGRFRGIASIGFLIPYETLMVFLQKEK